jgi:hypothetical protein
LTSGGIYTLIIESHGDFVSDPVPEDGNVAGTFSSLAELNISVLEPLQVPAPGSLVLLASALLGWFALGKRIRIAA